MDFASWERLILAETHHLRKNERLILAETHRSDIRA